MKISSQQVMATLQTHKFAEVTQSVGKKQQDASAAYGNSDTDSIYLSEQAQGLVKLQNALNEVPQTRQEKVQELKDQIQSGDYEVPAEDVAEKIISRAVVNEAFSAENK